MFWQGSKYAYGGDYVARYWESISNNKKTQFSILTKKTNQHNLFFTAAIPIN